MSVMLAEKLEIGSSPASELWVLERRRRQWWRTAVAIATAAGTNNT